MRILTEPKNALVPQYKMLFYLDKVSKFSERVLFTSEFSLKFHFLIRLRWSCMKSYQCYGIFDLKVTYQCT